MDGSSLARFRDVVRGASAQNNGTPIPSQTIDQASIVVERMFATAVSSICIMTGDLNPRLYGSYEVIAEAKTFLAQRETRLRVVFLNEQPRDIIYNHPLLNALRMYKNVQLFQSIGDFAELVRFHFIVRDEDASKWKQNGRGHSAVTAFGDPKLASLLIHVFDLVASKSHQIQPEKVAA